MAYIGRTPSGGRFAKLDDISSSFNGSANTFSLSIGADAPNIASSAQVVISVGGVIQEPETDFAVRTNQIVFTSAPPSGASFFGILLGETFNALVPSTRSIKGSHLSVGAINSNTLFGNGVITRHALANGAISANTLISTGSITADLIATGAVGPTELASGAVSANTKLGTGVITAFNIADDAIGPQHLQAGAVNANTVLATGAITADLIATGAVGPTELATGAVSANTKIAANVIDASNIKAGAVGSSELAAGAISANTKFDAGIITQHAIAAGNVVTSKINDAAVTSAKLAAGAVSANTKMAADVVGARELRIGNVAAANGVFTHNTHTFRNAQRARIEAVTVGAANVALDFANAQMFSITLGTNSNLNRPSNLTVGQSGTIFVVQDGTGSRTLSYSSVFDFVGGEAPTLTTTASAVDRIDYVVRTTSSIHAVASLALS